MPFDSLSNWSTVLQLCCQTQKTIKIISYGDWDFDLSRKRRSQVARPIQDIVKEQYPSYCYETNQIKKQLQVQDLPEFDNVSEALSNISVEINYTEQQFRQKYGFWQIKNFKVYNRDGNNSQCSFEDDNFFYFGRYGTS